MSKGSALVRGGYTAPSVSTLVSIATDDDLTPAIDIREAAFGGLLVPATVNGTELTFTVSDTLAGTYYALKDSSNTAIKLTISSATASAVPLPAEVFAFNFFKIATTTAQSTTDTQFVVTLKG